MANITEIIMRGKDEASKETQKVKLSLNSLAASAMQNNKKVGAAMAGIGAAITGAATLSVKNFAEMGDDIDKMSKRTGLSAEFLSEWRHVAELGGASLLDVQKGVRNLAQALTYASEGQATYIRAFERIGLEWEELRWQAPDKVFNAVLMALAATEDETAKLATAQNLLGRSGVALGAIIETDKETVAEMRQEAHELGIIFSEETATAAADVKDQMLEVQRATNGLSFVFAQALLPVLMPVAEALEEATKKLRGFADAHPVLTKVLVGATAALGAILIPLGTLLILLPQITAGWAIFSSTTIGATVATGALNIALIAEAVAAGIAGAATWVLSSAILVLASPIFLVIAAVAALIAIVILLVKNWDKVVSSVKAVGRAFAEFGSATVEIFTGLAEIIIMPYKIAFNTISTIINKLLGFLSNKELFSISVPDWVPGIGGKGWELRLPELPQIPTVGLATGGIAMKPMFAQIAEREPEAVIPLSKLNSGISVTIQSGAFLGTRADAEKFGDIIVDVLQRRKRQLGVAV